MNNLFAIGEIVVRRTSNYPEHNGEYEVEGIISSSEMKELHPLMRVPSGTIFYKLSGFNVKLATGEVSNHSCEDYLFKKHDGCGQDYNEMIKTLNTTIVEWA